MTARTAEASTVPEPHGKPNGPGAFHIKGAMFPPYIQHVAGELLKKGHSKSEAYQLAIGIVRDWAEGHNKGHKVSPTVQAAAAKAIAAYDALRARAKATPNKGRHDMSRTDLSVFDPSKHPRGGKGSPKGGEFVPIGAARNSSAAKAQTNKASRTTYGHEIVASAGVQKARLARLSDSQLQALTRTTYSFKSSDPNVVKLRDALAAEMAKRGFDIKDFGALGGGIKTNNHSKTKAQAQAVGKSKTTKAEAYTARHGTPAEKKRALAALKKKADMSNQSEHIDLAVLTAKQRNNLKKTSFALPGSKYPIPDAAHARNALARVAQNGSPAEQAAVKRAVARKFPNIGKKKKATK